MTAMLQTTGAKVVRPSEAGRQAVAVLSARYELEMDPGSIPGLVARFGLRAPGDTG